MMVPNVMDGHAEGWVSVDAATKPHLICLLVEDALLFSQMRHYLSID